VKPPDQTWNLCQIHPGGGVLILVGDDDSRVAVCARCFWQKLAELDRPEPEAF